jgi:hypothetical protein
MMREPTSTDAEREAAVREQLDEAWTDIERALDAANVALELSRAAAASPPVVHVAPTKPADAVVSAPARRGRRWQAWALTGATLFFAAAVAYQLLAGVR